MRTRSGRVYSYRYFDRIERNRRLNRIVKVKIDHSNMAPPVTPSPSGSGAMRYTIVTKSSICPFAGYVNGKLPQGVESFVEAVDAHLLAKNITDEREAYLEARSYLDFSKGDLSSWSRTIAFKLCKTWSDLKTSLRQAYAKTPEQDCVLFIREIIKNTDRKGRSIVATAAQTSDMLLELTEKIKGTPWVEQTGDVTKITLGKLILLLQLAFTTAALPDRLVALFDEDLDENSSELTILDQIRRHKSKLPDLDPSILVSADNKSNESSSIALVSNKPFTRNHQDSRSSVQCFNCGKLGHLARNCHAFFCSIHNSRAHKYQNCMARSGNNRQQRVGNQNGGRFTKQEVKKKPVFKKHNDPSKHKNSKNTSSAAIQSDRNQHSGENNFRDSGQKSQQP